MVFIVFFFYFKLNSMNFWIYCNFTIFNRTKQYFPLNEFNIDIPILKLNLHKQTIFILNDYLDNYLYPILDMSILNRINKPIMTKDQIKQAKLRQFIYKRLLEDYFVQSKYKRTGSYSILF